MWLFTHLFLVLYYPSIVCLLLEHWQNPVNCFVNAAKQGSMDHLSGTLDAVAWGKEAPSGTGGPFEIVYSGKVRLLLIATDNFGI